MFPFCSIIYTNTYDNNKFSIQEKKNHNLFIKMMITLNFFILFHIIWAAGKHRQQIRAHAPVPFAAENV